MFYYFTKIQEKNTTIKITPLLTDAHLQYLFTTFNDKNEPLQCFRSEIDLPPSYEKATAPPTIVDGDDYIINDDAYIEDEYV